MPELPDVEAHAAALRERIAGRVVGGSVSGPLAALRSRAVATSLPRSHALRAVRRHDLDAHGATERDPTIRWRTSEAERQRPAVEAVEGFLVAFAGFVWACALLVSLLGGVLPKEESRERSVTIGPRLHVVCSSSDARSPGVG